jgi:hypothetical protein
MATRELTPSTADSSAKPPGTEHFPPFDLGRVLKTVFNPRPASESPSSSTSMIRAG